jgi:O-antigen ligase
MVTVVARPSPSKLRLDRTRTWLVQNKAAERLFVLAMCLVYLLHSIWLARTVLWFLVVPAVLLTAVPYRSLVPVVKSGVFVMASAFLLVIITTTMLGAGLPAGELFKQLRYAIAVLVFVAIVASSIGRGGDFLRLLFLFLVPAAAIAAVRDVGTYTGWSPQAMLAMRLQGTQGLSVYYNSNVIGMMYAMPCVGAVAMMMTRKLRFWQFALLFVSALILLGTVLLTGSRGSLLAVLAGIGVSVLLAANWRATAAIVALIALAAAATLLTPLAGELIQRRDSLRLELWPVYLHMVTLKPWLGYGIGFETARTLPDGNVVMNGHNIFLCAAVRGGVFAALALAGVVVAALWSGWRAFRLSGEVTALALLASCLAATSVDYEIIPSDLNYLYILFWLPVAISLGAGLAASGRRTVGAVPAADIPVSQKWS